MGTSNANDLRNAQTILNNLSQTNVKRVKKESGLIERENMDDKKIILAEDNRQILLG